MSPTHEFIQVSFVNGIYTNKGGKHVEYILNQVTRKLCAFIEKKKNRKETVDFCKTAVLPKAITQQAIFDKWAPQDPLFSGANLATQQAIAQKFGLSWDQTFGGAAMGNPLATRKYANTGMSDGTEKLAAIGGSGAINAAMGYFGPQILQGASTLAQGVPALRPISGALNVMGQLTKQVGPTTRAVIGGISGLSSETSGQVAEQMGAGPVTAEAARLVGGAITPEFAPLALNTAKLMLSGKVATSGINFAKDLMANLTNSKGSLTTAEKKYVES
jgi:hypothetical protein